MEVHSKDNTIYFKSREDQTLKKGLDALCFVLGLLHVDNTFYCRVKWDFPWIPITTKYGYGLFEWKRVTCT
jgi:hypothetical protein